MNKYRVSCACGYEPLYIHYITFLNDFVVCLCKCPKCGFSGVVAIKVVMQYDERIKIEASEPAIQEPKPKETEPEIENPDEVKWLEEHVKEVEDDDKPKQ